MRSSRNEGLGLVSLERLIDIERYRGLAQSGSAPALGAGCRGFESLIPDQPHSKHFVERP